MANLTEFLNTQNVAELLNEKALAEIGSDALDGYQKDVDSRYEWEQRNDQWMRLAAQVVEHKSFPWENASNVKYPSILLFAKRSEPAPPL